MKQAKRIFIGVAAIVLLGLSAGVSAQESPRKGQIEFVEEVFERAWIWIDSGMPDQVRLKTCQTCAYQVYPADPELKFFENGKEVSRNRFRQGQTAAFFYNLKSGRAVRIAW